MVSCSEPDLHQAAVPANLLTRQQMAEVLSDIQIAEAAVAQKNFGLDSANRINSGYYRFIYKKHGVKQADFEGSYQYYLSLPIEMDSIYASTIEIISNKESKLRGIVVKNPK